MAFLNFPQLKLEDLLDRVATHISDLRARIAFRSNRARAEPFGKYVDLPWTVSPEKSFFVQDLDGAQLVLVEVRIHTCPFSVVSPSLSQENRFPGTGFVSELLVRLVLEAGLVGRKPAKRFVCVTCRIGF